MNNIAGKELQLLSPWPRVELKGCSTKHSHPAIESFILWFGNLVLGSEHFVNCHAWEWERSSFEGASLLDSSYEDSPCFPLCLPSFHKTPLCLATFSEFPFSSAVLEDKCPTEVLDWELGVWELGVWLSNLAFLIFPQLVSSQFPSNCLLISFEALFFFNCSL